MRPHLSVKFRDIWRGAIAGDDILDLKIKIPEEKSFFSGTEERQWISIDLTISMPLPYVRLTSHEVIDLRTKNGVFRVCANNPIFDVRSKFAPRPALLIEESIPFEQTTPLAKIQVRTDSAEQPSEYLRIVTMALIFFADKRSIGSATDAKKARKTDSTMKLLK